MSATATTGRVRIHFRNLSLRRREAIACGLFVAPAVLGFLAFSLVPLLVSLGASFTNYSLAGWPDFVGLENYKTLFNDKLFWQSVRVTATYVVVVVPLWLINSLVLALIMNQSLPGVRAFRTVFYLPAVLSGVSIAIVWLWLLNYRLGLINTVLGFAGIAGPNWMGDKNWTLAAIILMSQWSIGWYLPLWLGGLQGIPTELFEAVEIDGGGLWARLRHVTLPILSPLILYNLVMNIIWATQLFTEPFVMTSGMGGEAATGGPQFSVLSYVLYLYNNAFIYMKMGLASAMGWIMFLVVLAMTFVVFKSSPMWVYYEAERRNK